MQTKKQSLVESITNVIIGYVVALISQLIIFPFFGIDVPLKSNIKIGIFFTAVSIARSYALRRWFNRRIIKNSHKEKIKCPECGLVQVAEVEHGWPFNIYVHCCIKCEYIIIESEWEKI